MTAILSKPGLCSLTEDEKHILMFDIDIKDIMYRYKVSDEVRRIQDKFILSSFYLFKTTNGYHAYCLDKFSLEEAWKIYNDCKFKDDSHTYIGYAFRKHWVLRIGKNIEHIETIHPSPFKRSTNERSNAHRMFLNMQYGLDIHNDLSFDCYTKCLIIRYPQRSKGHT